MGIETDALLKEIFSTICGSYFETRIRRSCKINDVVKKLNEVEGVKEVKNDSKLTIEVYNNLNRILTWILAFSILFLIVAMVLINNSIRLKIFSKRFIIKTMQLVGAKRRFI